MKNLLLVLTIGLAPLFAQAAPAGYVCASMPHAEAVVAERANNFSDVGGVQALYGADEYLNNGKFVMRKIVVRVSDMHSARFQDMVVSYSIVKSFDGPDHGHSYCNLAGVEFKKDVCNARPDLDICRQ